MSHNLYLCSDVADALAAVGSTCRTPAAVRSAVDDGRLEPDLQTPRGVKAWSEEALRRDVERMWRRHRLRLSSGRLGLPERAPKQLEIGG